ncbi:MAG: response regulator, partial [Planctomycetota bacterium]
TFTVTVDTGDLTGVETIDQTLGDAATATEQRDDTPVQQADEQRGALHGRSILFCEDGPDNQRIVSHYLRRAGADVTLADNGREGVEAVDARGTPGFDLILMDMQMPELDGYAATRALRRQGVDTPIVALTAHAMASDRQKCLDAGCDDHATKPIDRDALIATCVEWAGAKSDATPDGLNAAA